MSNLREAYAATALASLEWSADLERAVDRVAAAGKAPRMALDLWKSKYQYESTAYLDLRKGLVRLFLERYRSEHALIAEKCVEQALHEHLGPACMGCSGSREVIHEGLRVKCPECEGSGLRIYRDEERAKTMGLGWGRTKTLSHKLSWLSKELGTMDRMVNSIIAAELERA